MEQALMVDKLISCKIRPRKCFPTNIQTPEKNRHQVIYTFYAVDEANITAG